MRLIEADAAMKKLGGECIAKYPSTFTMGLLAAVREIDNMPTIEQPLLTVKEKADIHRICITIEQKCRDMMLSGMWERYTRHMECGEIREFAQYYRDMETVYKALTGVELFPQKGDE